MSIWYFWLTIEKVSEIPDAMQPVRIASSVVGAVSNCASPGVVSSVRLEGSLSINRLDKEGDSKSCSLFARLIC